MFGSFNLQNTAQNPVHMVLRVIYVYTLHSAHPIQRDIWMSENIFNVNANAILIKWFIRVCFVNTFYLSSIAYPKNLMIHIWCVKCFTYCLLEFWYITFFVAAWNVFLRSSRCHHRQAHMKYYWTLHAFGENVFSLYYLISFKRIFSFKLNV